MILVRDIITGKIFRCRSESEAQELFETHETPHNLEII